MMSDFTAQDYRQLSEALEWEGDYVEALQEERSLNLEPLEVIMDAARRFRDRYQICQTCDGAWFHQNVFCPGAGQEGSTCHPCPDCVGGLVPNQELDQTRLRIEARKEWTLQLKADHVSVPSIWNRALWLDHLAARTEYIVRQLPGITVGFDLDHEAYAAAVRAFDKGDQ